jgi:pimeloyl-ACP methyl ester carboxylesterase
MHTVAKTATTGAAAPAAVRRTAFYLPSQGDGLFAWLHDPGDGPRLDHGVVICPPVGYEQIHSHRSMRHLADALARAGFVALRFDYHSTGDSPGTDDDPDRLATWRANVADALAWLRQQLGCRHVSAVGLRLGATLAAEVAEQQPVDQLVVWAPVIKGRTFVRELIALGLATHPPGESPARPAADVEAGGFVFTRQTVADLQRLDLRRCRPRCRRLLLVSRDDLSPETDWIADLTASGIAADHVVQPGYTGMMAEPHANQVPRQAIIGITEWLRAGAECERPPTDDLGGLDALPTETWVNGRQPGVRERVLHLRTQPNLFGIVTEPAGGVTAARPTILMVNAGSAHRVAPSRLYVLLARALAERGFRCLRVDLGGLGDSVSPSPDYENHPYPPNMFPDIAFALRQLESGGRVVLLGLCSGAYAAFQSAVHLTSPALVESVVINPLAFYWREGMPLGVPGGPSPLAQLAQMQYLHRAALDPRKWLDLLTGKTRLGITGIARLLVRHWRRRFRPVGGSGPQRFENGHPVREDLPADLDQAVRAGRRLAFFFGTRDPSHGILMFHAARKMRQLRRAGAVSVSLIDDADHTFTGRGPREALVRSVGDYLAGRYG